MESFVASVCDVKHANPALINQSICGIIPGINEAEDTRAHTCVKHSIWLCQCIIWTNSQRKRVRFILLSMHLSLKEKKNQQKCRGEPKKLAQMYLISSIYCLWRQLFYVINNINWSGGTRWVGESSHWALLCWHVLLMSAWVFFPGSESAVSSHSPNHIYQVETQNCPRPCVHLM